MIGVKFKANHAKIMKKMVILFWLLNMAIRCEHCVLKFVLAYNAYVNPDMPGAQDVISYNKITPISCVICFYV